MAKDKVEYYERRQGASKMPSYEGGTVTVQKKTIGIIGLIALFPTLYLIFGVYIGMHRALAEDVAKTVMTTRIAQIEQKIDVAQKTANDSAAKLDAVGRQMSYMLVESAISAVAALKILRDEHMANQRNTADWRREKLRLDAAIETAILRRDCLLENRNNCDLLH